MIGGRQLGLRGTAGTGLLRTHPSGGPFEARLVKGWGELRGAGETMD